MATRQIVDFERLKERKRTYCDADLSLPVRKDLARVIAEAARHYQHAKTILDRSMKDSAKLRARMEKVHTEWVRNREIRSAAQAFPGLNSSGTFKQHKLTMQRKFIVNRLGSVVSMTEIYSSSLLENAKAKMIIAAGRHPGSYVVVCGDSGTVLARTDSRVRVGVPQS